MAQGAQGLLGRGRYRQESDPGAVAPGGAFRGHHYSETGGIEAVEPGEVDVDVAVALASHQVDQHMVQVSGGGSVQRAHQRHHDMCPGPGDVDADVRTGPR